MIDLRERQPLAHNIQIAQDTGVRLHAACETAGIDTRSLQRGRACGGMVDGDGRPKAILSSPAHDLSLAERTELLRVANEPRFATMPPTRIVPTLANDGVSLASESNFARVLRAHGQASHRGRTREPRAVRPLTTHIATAPRQVWCWEMTYSPGMVTGHWFHLYLIPDLYKR